MRAEMTKKIFLSLILFILFSGADKSKSPLGYREDAVVVKGKEIPSMLGAEIERFSLFRWSGKNFEPVAFQIDERTQEGNFIFPNGKKKNPELSNGQLDALDELVFMAWDTGASAPEPISFPEKASQGVEIIITDDIQGKKASVYLFSFANSPPRSEIDYVEHFVEEGRNYVRSFSYLFGEPIKQGFFDRLHLVSPDGVVAENMVDRIKGRGFIRSLGGLVKFNAGEQDTPAELVAWIDGPVRVVRRMEGGVNLFGLKIKLAGGSDNIFYQNYFYTPIFFTLPAGASSIMKGSYMIYTIDFNKNFLPSYYFDGVNKEPVVLDGRMDERERNLDMSSDHNWYAVGGEKGNLVVRMIIPVQWKDYATMTAFYVDDESQSDPPESEIGRHQPGFKLSGMFEAPSGKYNYYLYYMVSDKKLTQENVGVWLDILDHPLKITSKALTKK